jgi:hypothetical protein
MSDIPFVEFGIEAEDAHRKLEPVAGTIDRVARKQDPIPEI